MNADFRDFGFWCDFLAWTWGRSRRRMVDLILTAGRVRENWMQGDLFLAARSARDPAMPYFYCNAQPSGYGASVDWSYWTSNQDESDDPATGAVPQMIAELKFLGGSYHSKVFAGLGTSPSQFAVNGGEYELLIGPDHPVLQLPRLGFLLEDYQRLLRYHNPADPLRMLVLLLDKRYDKSELANCLASVEFERPGAILIDTPTWICKAWEIKGRAAKPTDEDPAEHSLIEVESETA
jgi:hypothetical protein